MLESLKKNETFEYQKLSKEEMASKGILGRLIGPCADFINPTRNGRTYGEDLWEHVFNDPIMKEKIANGVCFGELGHPADRTETDMEKIAICLREQPKKNSNGLLMACFDILDTPNGRILKTLCDYGTTIGVSSRGTGDLVTDDEGNEIVDPDTYECECWDAVLIPAVESARMTYVTEALDTNKVKLNKALCESLDKATESERKIMKETLNELNIKVNEEEDNTNKLPIDDMTEEEKEKGLLAIWGFKKQVSELTSEEKKEIEDIYAQLHNVKTNESIPEKGGDKLTESTDSKQTIEESEEAKDNGSDEMVKSLQEAITLKSELEATIKSLQEQLAVSDAKVKKLEEDLGKCRTSAMRLTTIATENKDLSSKNLTLEEELKVKERTIESQKLRISKLVESAKKESVGINSLNESISKKDTEVKGLKEELNEVKNHYESEIAQLNENLKTLKNDSESKDKEYCEKLERESKLKENYKRLANSVVNHYIDSKATMLGVSVNEIKNKLPESYTIDDIDSICEDLQSYALNISKLPISIDRKVNVKVRESRNETLNLNSDIDDEVDESLYRLAKL